MKPQTVAMVFIFVSMVVTIGLMSEGLVSYAPEIAREIQFRLQSRILIFGVVIVTLHIFAIGALLMTRKQSS